MKESMRQNFAHADMADPRVLNAIIWFACKGSGSPVPESAQLPAYQAMRLGIPDANDAALRRAEPDDDD
jgi:hypothetical protein